MPNWLGDCVMAMPALRLLTEAIPQAGIVLSGRAQFRDFFLMQDGVSGFVEAPHSGIKNLLRGIVSAKTRLRSACSEPPGVGILFTNSFSTALWLRAAGVPARIGYAMDCRMALLTVPVPFGEEERAWHCVQAYSWLAMRALRAAPAGRPEIKTPRVVVSPAAREQAASLLRSFGLAPAAPYAVLAPASAYGSVKDWPPEHYRVLTDELNREGLPVIVTGSPGQAEVCRSIAAGQKSAVNAAGRTSLNEFIGLLAGAALFVGGDSGGSHVAGALGVPAVVIFGITNPTRTRPLGERVRYVGAGEDEDVDLSTPGARERAARILADISPERVWAEAVAAMRG